VLRAGQLPPIEVISTTLINDILDLELQFLLVLDDFHVIQDGFILEVLEKLVANPPQPRHLVLLTREDPPLPLARLRANNRLTEIRARDLRFGRHDAERFLNEVLGLSLSPADIAVLGDKTEGWIVGLQLAGLSVRDHADPSSFIATLSGSHRFILSYLTEEVLSQQPEEIQRFLLQTFILDRLNGDLCNAVTGR
jgi:LuxR family maltose regulon positive regulatory protein